MRAILMFHNCEGQSQDSVHRRPQLLKRQESGSGFEPKSRPLLTSNALPLGQTASHHHPKPHQREISAERQLDLGQRPLHSCSNTPIQGKLLSFDPFSLSFPCLPAAFPQCEYLVQTRTAVARVSGMNMILFYCSVLTVFVLQMANTG